MTEDRKIENLVREALEADVAVSAKTLQTLETAAAHATTARRALRQSWLRSGLLAAAALTAVVFFGDAFFHDAASDGMAEVRDAVGLLCAVDGLDEDWASCSPGEMLLAWQDAPCADWL